MSQIGTDDGALHQREEQPSPTRGSRPKSAKQGLSREDRSALSGFVVGILLVGLDSTIVGTITPTVVSELQGLTLASWVFGGYLLAQTVFAPILGKLSDQFGIKPCFYFGLGIFTFGSLLCGCAATMEQLIAFRVVQGVGSGAIFPIAISAISLRFPAEMRSRAQGLFSAVFTFSSVCGPLVGTIASRYGSWRYAFYLNLPIAIGAILLIHRYYSDRRVLAGRSIDYWGALSLCVTVTSSLMVFLRAGQSGQWFDHTNCLLILLSGLAAAILMRVEARAIEPIVSLELVVSKWVVVVQNLILGALMFSAILFVPMFVAGSPGRNGTIASGLAMLPLMLAMVVGSSVSGRFVHQVGMRKMVAYSMGLFMLGFLWISRLAECSSLVLCVVPIIAIGVGLGIGLVSLVYGMMVGLPPKLIGVGSSSVQFFRNLGGLVGVNVFAGLHAIWFLHAPNNWSGETEAVVRALGGARSVGRVIFSDRADHLISADVLGAVRGSFVQATVRVFLVCAVLPLFGLALSAMLPRRSAGSAKGHQHLPAQGQVLGGVTVHYMQSDALGAKSTRGRVE